MCCQDSSCKAWPLLKQCVGVAGVIARTVKDVILFDSIFSDCHYPRPDMELKGYRLGYPVNYWKGLDTRVSLTVPCTHALVKAAVLRHTHACHITYTSCIMFCLFSHDKVVTRSFQGFHGAKVVNQASPRWLHMILHSWHGHDQMYLCYFRLLLQYDC